MLPSSFCWDDVIRGGQNIRLKAINGSPKAESLSAVGLWRWLSTHASAHSHGCTMVLADISQASSDHQTDEIRSEQMKRYHWYFFFFFFSPSDISWFQIKRLIRKAVCANLRRSVISNRKLRLPSDPAECAGTYTPLLWPIILKPITWTAQGLIGDLVPRGPFAHKAVLVLLELDIYIYMLFGKHR